MHLLPILMKVKTKQDRNFRNGMHLLTIFMGVKTKQNVFDRDSSPHSFYVSKTKQDRNFRDVMHLLPLLIKVKTKQNRNIMDRGCIFSLFS
jgi:hypothetical protein